MSTKPSSNAPSHEPHWQDIATETETLGAKPDDRTITGTIEAETLQAAQESGQLSINIDDFTPEHDHHHWQSILFVALLVALSTWWFWLGWDGQELKWKKNAAFIKQAGFWPLASLGGMVIFGTLHVLTRIISDKIVRDKLFNSPLSPIESAAYFILYVWLVPKLGYLPTTLLAFPLLMMRAGYRSKKWLIASILLPIAIVVLFKTLLGVNIPGGAIYDYLPEAIRNFMITRF